MHDSFEFREDFARASTSSGSPVMLCPVKWAAAKAAMDVLRSLAAPAVPSSVAAMTAVRRTVAVLDQVGLTPDFEPSAVPAPSVTDQSVSTVTVV